MPRFFRPPPADWPGISRLASTPGRAIYYDGAYAPFGESYAETGSADRSFTGMNQDTVSALYDFPAREYGIQGRWPSPDPAGMSAVDPSDPQTWNRYAYVRNSPLAVVDPTGLFECPICLPQSGGGGGLGYDICFFAPGVCGGGGFIQSPPVQPPGQCFYILLDPCGGGNGSRNPGSKTASTGNQPQKQSYADCVKNSGNEASVQGLLGLGNSKIAGAFLGNPFSDLIQFGQNLSNGQFSGAAPAADAAANAAPTALRTVPNVAVSYSSTTVVATPSTFTTITTEIEGVLPLGTIASGAADLLEGFGKLVTIPVSATATAFGAVVCAAGPG